MNILIIGSDSFIAQQFISNNSNFVIQGIARLKTNFENEIVVNDFNKIEINQFSKTVVIINFAAIVHRPDIKDESIYDDINYKLTLINAQKAKNAGVNLFIQMSTIAVYGNVSNILINTPYNPKTPYGISKLKADEELLAMQDYNFKVAIIRPPMVYGGGKAPGNMMRLIKLVDKRIPLPFKDIDNRRDFINVHNLVQYLSLIAEKQLTGIHLISDHEPVSTEYLLNTIAKYYGKKVPLLKFPEFVLRMIKKLRPNEYNKLFRTLTIETNFPYEDLIKRYTVEQGIAEMVEWYKHEYKN